jgi:hypothetical protein
MIDHGFYMPGTMTGYWYQQGRGFDQKPFIIKYFFI